MMPNSIPPYLRGMYGLPPDYGWLAQFAAAPAEAPKKKS